MEKIISFYSKHKRPIALGAIAVFALSIPIIVAQVLKQQDLRQHAAAGAPVTLTLRTMNMPTPPFGVNDAVDVQLSIDTNTNDISAIDGYLNFDSTHLTLVSETVGDNYTNVGGSTVYRTTNQDGTVTIEKEQVLINQSVTPKIGSSIVLYTFHFKAIANGQAKITFGDSTNKLKIAASGYSGNVPAIVSLLTIDVAIGSSNNLSPTPTTCPAGGNCPIPTPTPCAAGSSPVVLPDPPVYVFTYAGATIPVTDFAKVLSPNVSNVQRATFPSGRWSSWFRPAPQLATLTSSIENGDLLSVGGTMGGVTGFEAGLCMKNSYDPDPIQTGVDATDHTTIITASPPPAGTTTYDYIDTNNIHWLFWVNKGKQYEMRQDSTAPTPTRSNPPVDMCTATKYRPTNCACTENNQCRSTLCSSSKCTPKPTITVAPGSTGLKLSVSMPGIAQKLSNNEDNQNPVNPSRIAKIVISDASNSPVSDQSGVLAFNLSSYKFEGAIDLGANFATGSYTVKVGLDNTLVKLIPGIVAITQGGTNNAATSITLIPGDVSQNNTIDIQDWNNMIACNENKPACTADIKAVADLNDDGIINQHDVDILQRGFYVRNGD